MERGAIYTLPVLYFFVAAFFILICFLIRFSLHSVKQHDGFQYALASFSVRVLLYHTIENEIKECSEEMSEFDKVIGYDNIKKELVQICDMMKNEEVYKKLGAKIPKGILLYGEPGVGKSLMAHAFIEESGRNKYVLKRDRPNGDFINEIKRIFTEAGKNTPSVILLDDMDKYAVKDHDTEEFTVLQTCMDTAHQLDVFIIATVNEMGRMPRSLKRVGRFDRKIKVRIPDDEDAEKIIEYYMSTKEFADGLNSGDIAKMLAGHSCAELETALNEAAVYAGFERSDKINMGHITNAVLKTVYNIEPKEIDMESMSFREIVYHEAGHVVVGEILNPGSVGLAVICADKNGTRGITAKCKKNHNADDVICVGVAGKVSSEIKTGKTAEGVESDIKKVVATITGAVCSGGAAGLSLVQVLGDCIYECSEDLKRSQEVAVHTLLESYVSKTRRIICENIEFVEKTAAELTEKKVLLYSDIKRIRSACKITDTAS